MKRLLRSGISRRGLLGSIVGVGVGMASLAYPGLARVLTTAGHPLSVGGPTLPQDTDQTFWSGTVTAKTKDTLVLTSAVGTRTVRIPPGSLVWKEFDVPLDAVDLGDQVMVKGEPQPDGSLLARPGLVWANGASWDATILGLRPGGLIVKRHRDGAERSLLFSQRLEVITAAKQLPVPEGARALSVGLDIGAVGLALPDGNLRATRIWIYRR